MFFSPNSMLALTYDSTTIFFSQMADHEAFSFGDVFKAVVPAAEIISMAADGQWKDPSEYSALSMKDVFKTGFHAGKKIAPYALSAAPYVARFMADGEYTTDIENAIAAMPPPLECLSFGDVFNVGKNIAKFAINPIGTVVNAIHHIGKEPRSVRLLREQKGQWKITSIIVGKQQLASAIKGAVKVVTGLKQTLYHLFMYIQLKDPVQKKTTWIRLEKEQKVTVSQEAPIKKKNVLIYGIQVSQSLTLNEFFENVQKYAKLHHLSLWQYDAITANCQYFVKWCLDANGMWNSKLQSFVMQNLNGVPTVSKSLMKGITNAANVGSTILFGSEAQYK